MLQALLLWGSIGALPIQAETRFIPSLNFSERYDSNVFIAPSGSTPPGKKPWDLATSLIPGIQILDKDRAIETDLTAKVSGTAFINNPELNFFSASLVGILKLDGLVGRLIPGLKLQVSDSFIYTPEAPSFVDAGTPAPSENPFARGIVPVRADTFSNTASVSASYPLWRSLRVDGTYAYSLFRVGQILVESPTATPAVFFNTDFQTLTLGPIYRIARGDEIGLTYKLATAKFTDASVNASGESIDETVRSHGLELRYSTKVLHWAAFMSGGATIVDQDGSAFFSGRVGLSWAYDPSTQLSVDVSRQLAPAFFGTAGVMISSNAGVTFQRRFTDSLFLSLSANYAVNEGTAGNVIRFESYSGHAILNYNFTLSTVASLSYQQVHFETSSPGTESVTNRGVVMFSITSTWR